MESAGQGEGRRILVCDDLPPIRTLIRINLELEGFVVEEFPEGRALLARLLDAAAPVPDAVVLDAHMSGADGWWAIGAIRADPRASQVPVALVTASSGEHDRTAAERAGFDAFVAKPFDPATLVEVVSRLVGLLPPAPVPNRIGG
jgi:CheY-like chemotaxis protein